MDVRHGLPARARARRGRRPRRQGPRDARSRARAAGGVGPRRDLDHARHRRVPTRRERHQGSAARRQGGHRYRPRPRTDGPRVPRRITARPGRRQSDERADADARDRRAGRPRRRAARRGVVGARAGRRASDRRPDPRRRPLVPGQAVSEVSDSHGFETRAIHSGQEPDARTGAVVPPITLATTFAQDGVGAHRGYEYSRSGNPTRSALETCVASLEGARHGIAFASGLAAEDALLRMLEPGDHVIIPNDAYGGTYRLVARVHEPHGVGWGAVDMRDMDAIEREWRDETRLVWVETPTNPMLSIVDVGAVCDIAHARSARVVVDNTFATPYLQQPLALGADSVVHSSTKYLGGHSDVVGGFVAVSDEEVADEVRFLQNAMGA